MMQAEKNERFVFGAPATKKELFAGLWLAGACFVAALGAGAASAFVSFPFSGLMWVILLSAGTAALFWEMHARFMGGAPAKDVVAVVIDAAGVHLLKAGVEKAMTVEWPRLKAADVEGAALLLDFAPEDAGSADPLMRISHKRVALKNVEPADVLAAMRKFKAL